jgi:hypothetical protein
MQTIQQIDKRLTEKMDEYERLGKPNKAHDISKQTSILVYINAIIWTLGVEDWDALPKTTRQRLEKIGH